MKPLMLLPGWWAIVWRKFAQRRLNSWALWGLGLLVVLALVADFVAAEQPILLSFHGRFYVLPNLVRPSALRIFDNQMLREAMQPGDWALVPLVPWGPNTHDLTAVLVAPTSAHWLGTDASGRDVLARIIHGTRVSLLVGAMSVLLMVGVGTTLGIWAGYSRGLVDAVLMRVIEIMHSIPTMLLLVTVLAVAAPQGQAAIWVMILVIGLVRWTDVARLARGEAMRVRTMDFVQAARAQGASSLWILRRHIIPNSSGPVLVSASFGLGAAILVEGSLSFLGFGIPDDIASWGGLLSGVRANVQAWWLAVFPGVAVFVTVTAVNIVGEGIRDATDPRLRS